MGGVGGRWAARCCCRMYSSKLLLVLLLVLAADGLALLRLVATGRVQRVPGSGGGGPAAGKRRGGVRTDVVTHRSARALLTVVSVRQSAVHL